MSTAGYRVTCTPTVDWNLCFEAWERYTDKHTAMDANNEWALIGTDIHPREGHPWGKEQADAWDKACELAHALIHRAFPTATNLVAAGVRLWGTLPEFETAKRERDSIDARIAELQTRLAELQKPFTRALELDP